DGPAAFRIYEGDGLIMYRDGSSAGLGTPRFVYEHDRGVAVGNNAWTHYAVERLDSISTVDTAPQGTPAYFDDVRSTWASVRAAGLIAEASAATDPIPLVREALTYLRNWDYSYDRASIAASIFDAWTIALRSAAPDSSRPDSSPPDSSPPDSSSPDSSSPDPSAAEGTGAAPDARVAGDGGGSSDSLAAGVAGSPSPVRPAAYVALEDAVRTLASEYGEDPSQWRWEQTQPHRYHFPLWSSDASLAVDLEPLARTRYAPITLQGSGHETTLYHGPSRISGGAAAPSRFEAWTSTARWEAFNYRSRRFPVHRFLGRYLVSDRIPDPAAVPARGRVAYTTTLLPD
ncbi:MAG: penicillin acylase family protein, partial [Rhodothermales bacterium]